MQDPGRKEDDLVNTQVRGTTRDMTSISVPRSAAIELKRRALELETELRHRVTIGDIISDLLGISRSLKSNTDKDSSK